MSGPSRRRWKATSRDACRPILAACRSRLRRPASVASRWSPSLTAASCVPSSASPPPSRCCCRARLRALSAPATSPPAPAPRVCSASMSEVRAPTLPSSRTASRGLVPASASANSRSTFRPCRCPPSEPAADRLRASTISVCSRSGPRARAPIPDRPPMAAAARRPRSPMRTPCAGCWVRMNSAMAPFGWTCRPPARQWLTWPAA